MTTTIEIPGLPETAVTINLDQLGLDRATDLAKRFIEQHPSQRHNLLVLSLQLHHIRDCRSGTTVGTGLLIEQRGQIVPNRNGNDHPFRLRKGEAATLLLRSLRGADPIPFVTVRRHP